MRRSIKQVCVFCGSSPGSRPSYLRAARELGVLLAKRKLTVIYGAGNVGLMGALADAALGAGGKVIGVIPKSLVEKEVAHNGLGDLRIVDSMHERKATMAALADAFIALPGGLGTLEEFFEVLTWAQLGMHDKPSGILDVDGYYEKLMAFIDHTVAQRFVKPQHRNMILYDADPEALLTRFASYRARVSDKWIDRKTA